MTLDVLLDDGPVLAVSKPAGILTEGPAAATDTLVVRAKEYLRRTHQKPGNVYLGVPHRLDRVVSGVVVFAKNSKAASRLALQFRDRQVAKTYWALVAHKPREEQGTFIDWIEKSPDRPTGRVVEAYSPFAKEAISHFRVLRSVAAGWLLEVKIDTGRFHQIRIQLAHHGCPILGDRMYGSPFDLPGWESAPGEPPPQEPPIALHARSIALLHPIRYELLTVVAPPPPHLVDLL